MIRLLLPVLMLVSACTGEFIITEDNCRPGTVQSCTCHDGSDGAQTCAKNGRYFEKCECGAVVPLTVGALQGVWQFESRFKGVLSTGQGGAIGAGALLIGEIGGPPGGLTVEGTGFEVLDPEERTVALRFRVATGDGEPTVFSGKVGPSARVITGRLELSSDDLPQDIELRRVRDDASGWACHPTWRGRHDGCDCGCGALDEGCDAGACDWCFDEQGQVRPCP